jgi:hypothetical protein
LALWPCWSKLLSSERLGRPQADVDKILQALFWVQALKAAHHTAENPVRNAARPSFRGAARKSSEPRTHFPEARVHSFRTCLEGIPEQLL